MTPKSPWRGSFQLSVSDAELLDRIVAYQQSRSEQAYLALSEALSPLRRAVMSSLEYAYDSPEDAEASFAVALLEAVLAFDTKKPWESVRLRLRGDILNRLRREYRPALLRKRWELLLPHQVPLLAPGHARESSLRMWLGQALRAGWVSELEVTLLLGRAMGYSAAELGKEHNLSQEAVRQRISRAVHYLLDGRKRSSQKIHCHELGCRL